MKILLIILLFSLNGFAADLGGHLLDTKTKDKIAFECIDADCTEAYFTLNGKVMNTNLIMKLDDIQDRYYHLNMIIGAASTSRLPIPQIWHIMNMQKVTKKLRKLFFKMIDRPEFKGQFVKMSHKNFVEVIKAVENY